MNNTLVWPTWITVYTCCEMCFLKPWRGIFNLQQLSISQNQSSYQTTDISMEIFWFQKIYFEISIADQKMYFEISVVWDKYSRYENINRKCVIRRYYEISVFDISRNYCILLWQKQNLSRLSQSPAHTRTRLAPRWTQDIHENLCFESVTSFCALTLAQFRIPVHKPLRFEIIAEIFCRY